MDVNEIILNDKYLSSLDANWRSYYEELADFSLPRKAWINSPRYKGERLQFNFLYDTNAIRGVKICASGFHSNLSNQATKWFGMGTRRKALMDKVEIRKWFNDVEETMYSYLNGSNLDTVLQEFYTDSIVFGTGCIFAQKDDKDGVRFTSIPIEQINIEEDANGRVCAIYRTFKWTAKQAFKQWGSACGKSVMDALEDKPYDTFEFLHYVGARHERDVSKKDNKNMPYQSVWISKKDNHLIQEGGFQDFPYFVGRFYKDVNDARGYSPVMDILADIKLINAQKKTTLRRAMKEADPPMTMPSRGFLAPLNLNPAAINYRDEKTQADSIQAIGVGKGTFSIAQDVINDIKESIQDGLFVPLFRALSDVTKQMTVPEVQHRVSEAMVLLGPAVGRMTHEVHSPLIVWTFNQLYRQGKFVAAPTEIQGQEFDIVYLGPLAKAQRGSEMSNIQGFMQDVGMVAQFFPTVLDKISSDKVIDVISKIRSVTPEILEGDKEVKTTRENRQKAAQAQAQLQALQVGAGAAKDMGQAQHATAQAGAVK